MENVRKEVHLGEDFSAAAFEAAFDEFRVLYSVKPKRVICSPGVLSRFCFLFERSSDVAHLHSSRVVYGGISLVAAVLAPGTIVFEGEVDDVKMGDW